MDISEMNPSDFGDDMGKIRLELGDSLIQLQDRLNKLLGSERALDKEIQIKKLLSLVNKKLNWIADGNDLFNIPEVQGVIRTAKKELEDLEKY